MELVIYRGDGDTKHKTPELEKPALALASQMVGLTGMQYYVGRHAPAPLRIVPLPTAGALH